MDQSAPPDLQLLQTFYEVARTGSVTQAARGLGRSQPAISYRLRALERDLGVRLFEKIGRRLRLTEFGRRLQVECVDLLARSQRIRERVTQSQSRVEGPVTIGTQPTVASHLLVPELARLFEHYPDVAISFRFGNVSRLVERLRTGELDILVVVGDLDASRLSLRTVGEAALVAAISPELLQGPPGRMTPDRLLDYRYLAYGGEGDATFDIVNRFTASRGLENASTPHVPHIETLRELAASRAGYSLLPDYTIRRDEQAGRLLALRVEGLEETVKISVVSRQEQVTTPALDVVHDALHRLESLLG